MTRPEAALRLLGCTSRVTAHVLVVFALSLSACARAGIDDDLFEAGGLDSGMDSGPARQPCERGVTVLCNCDDGGVNGQRSCEQDSDSPAYGFLGACNECSAPDDMDAQPPQPDAGAASDAGKMDSTTPGDAAADVGAHEDTTAPAEASDRCVDGQQNGSESDIDCGGDCAGCAAGKKCQTAGDCAGNASCSGTCMSVSSPSFRNYDHGSYGYAHSVDWSCAGTTRFNSSGSGSWAQTTSCSNTDATRPEISCGVVQTSSGGPEVCILRAHGLTIGAGHTLEIIGDRPVIIAVEGDATIAGTISADADGTTPGAGGNWSCGSSQGGNGEGDTGRFNGASGGGGGGFSSRGGAGGTGNTDGNHQTGGAAGQPRGNVNLSPLVGGCAGGQGGGCSAAGGAGGGAIEIAASGKLTIRGTVHADGANGATPCGANDEGGGTGAGSGGAILLQGGSIDTSGATLRTRGGNGGHNGSFAGIFNCGDSAGGNGATSASQNGGDGQDCQGGGSGAGGGYGRVVTQ
jgi:hypothetical protein